MRVVMKSREKMVLVAEIKESLVNALRRGVSEIPVLAVDHVEFYKNDSVLNDQILAHRIGLVPLKNEDLELPEECSCKGEGCSKCTIQLKVSTTGPRTVYAKDLKGKADPVYGEMPIAILDKDQELEFVAHARLGKGTAHAKHAPGLIFYRHLLRVDGKNEQLKQLFEKYKKFILYLEKEGNGYIADLPEACLEELEHLDGVTTSQTPLLALIIESFGQMEAKEILLESIDGLRKGLKQVMKE